MSRRPSPNHRPSRRGAGFNAWKTVAIIILLLALAVMRYLDGRDDGGAGQPPASEMAQNSFRCAVDYVNDGDTLRCKDGTRVRLHAISAREADNTCSAGHPCSATSAGASSRALRDMVAGHTLDCMRTGQSYDRVTAICWTPSGTEVNCEMVRSGKAERWDRFHREIPICELRRP